MKVQNMRFIVSLILLYEKKLGISQLIFFFVEFSQVLMEIMFKKVPR